jgi:hypothetical protein
VLVLDASKKIKEEGFTRAWPQKIVMREDIVKLVDEKWDRYGLGVPRPKSPTGQRVGERQNPRVSSSDLGQTL